MSPEAINSAIDNLIADARQLPELRREIEELKAINKEMYEALCAVKQSSLCSLCEFCGDDNCDECIIDKALRKARGEANLETNSEEMNQ